MYGSQRGGTTGRDVLSFSGFDKVTYTCFVIFIIYINLINMLYLYTLYFKGIGVSLLSICSKLLVLTVV